VKKEINFLFVRFGGSWFLQSSHRLASNGISESTEGFGTFWNLLEPFGTFWNLLEHFGTGEFESQSPEVGQSYFSTNHNGAVHCQKKWVTQGNSHKAKWKSGQTSFALPSLFSILSFVLLIPSSSSLNSICSLLSAFVGLVAFVRKLVLIFCDRSRDLFLSHLFFLNIFYSLEMSFFKTIRDVVPVNVPQKQISEHTISPDLPVKGRPGVFSRDVKVEWQYDLFGGAGDRCYCELPPSATIIEIIKKEEGGKGTLWTAFDQRGHDWKFRLSGGSLDSGSATYTIHFLLPSTIHLFC